MCMITAGRPLGLLARFLARWARPVQVSQTRIFARRVDGRQALIYAMRLSTRSDAVMVLPLPVARDRADSDAALDFVDLSAYPHFFDDLDRAFPLRLSTESPGRKGGFRAPSAPQLVVHEVGAYEASYAPTLADLDRLDPRFRLPDDVWAALPQYADHGFAVFKLRRGSRQRVHPMAFWFDTREPADTLLFPTVHVHDRQVHARADFDHELYLQLPEPQASLALNDRSTKAQIAPDLAAHVDLARTSGLVAPHTPAYRVILRGELDNVDHRVTPIRSP